MKHALALGLILASGALMAQSAKVVTAGVTLKNGQLDKAWENIEAATLDPKTSIDPKTWDYRFKILNAIFDSQNIEYRSLVPLEKIPSMMKESYLKVKELDTKKKYVEDLEKTIKYEAALVSNSAIESYNVAATFENFKDTLKKYQLIDDEGMIRVQGVEANLDVLKSKAGKEKSIGREAVIKCLDGDKAKLLSCLDENSKKVFAQTKQAFELAVMASDIIGVVDTANIFNAAICAEKAGQKKEAAELYAKAANYNYGGPRVFSFAARLYKELGLKENQINIIKQGRAAHPEDLDLLVDELNIYLEKEDYVASEKLLKAAIEKAPNNEIMFYVLGSTYDKLANPTDKNNKELPKPTNYTDLLAKAKESYERALQLKPEYFDALYNYGVLLFNEGVEYNNRANALDYKTKKAQVDELNKKADAQFKAAIAPFEKAMAIKGDDIGVLTSLKQLYVRMEMTDKYNMVKAKLDQLQ
ncbi:MAG TPA: hypothetical protein VFV37_03965 [Luteibaculaceae bacterium]|nr:hypothetical protein [Luteibaculaceae bacterium]